MAQEKRKDGYPANPNGTLKGLAGPSYWVDLGFEGCGLPVWEAKGQRINTQPFTTKRSTNSLDALARSTSNRGTQEHDALHRTGPTNQLRSKLAHGTGTPYYLNYTPQKINTTR